MTMGNYRDGWNHAMEEEALPRIKELEAALQALVDNVLDYERVNKLSPNPGREYCWDTMAHAVSVLDKTK